MNYKIITWFTSKISTDAAMTGNKNFLNAALVAMVNVSIWPLPMSQIKRNYCEGHTCGIRIPR